MGVKVRQLDDDGSCGGEGYARDRKSPLPSKPSSFFQNIFFKDVSLFLQGNLGISPRAFLNLGITLLIGESFSDQSFAKKKNHC